MCSYRHAQADLLARVGVAAAAANGPRPLPRLPLPLPFPAFLQHAAAASAASKSASSQPGGGGPGHFEPPNHRMPSFAGFPPVSAVAAALRQQIPQTQQNHQHKNHHHANHHHQPSPNQTVPTTPNSPPSNSHQSPNPHPPPLHPHRVSDLIPQAAAAASPPGGSSRGGRNPYSEEPMSPNGEGNKRLSLFSAAVAAIRRCFLMAAIYGSLGQGFPEAFSRRKTSQF